MKELDSFTVERLEELARGHDGEPLRPTMGEIKFLARIALAAKRAEPVDEIAFDMARGIMALVNETNIGGTVQLQAKIQCFIEEALTTTPQLNSPEMPDGWKLVPIELINNLRDAAHFEKVWCADVYGDLIDTGFRKDEYEKLTATCKAVDELLSPLPTPPEKENG
jgi:hypothetical protein